MKILESSLSSVWRNNEKFDCGAITAFRTYRDCNTKIVKFSKAENKQRNRSLTAKLLALGYSVIATKGTSVEGTQSVKENSYFVVDILKRGKLLDDLIKLGIEFEQDSILFCPVGSLINKAQAKLYGTNDCPGSLGTGNTMAFNAARFGKLGQYYTSFVNGRPFIFEGASLTLCSPNTGFGRWYINTVANTDWELLPVNYRMDIY